MSTDPGLSTRAQADAQLRTLAAYYKTNHPESPVGHALERIIRWSGMDWVSLQNELFTGSKDAGDFKKIVALAVGVDLDKSQASRSG